MIGSDIQGLYSPTPLVKRESLSVGVPSVAEIRQVRLNCRALLRATWDMSRLNKAFEAWTQDLLPSIVSLANQGLDNEPIDLDIKDYNDVLHLFFIPNITDVLEDYMEEPQTSPIPPTVPLLHCIASGSKPDSLSSDEPQVIAQDPKHPGQGWEKFDPTNTSQYPLVFVNELGQVEAATYVSFKVVEDETCIEGTREKGAPVYSMPLHACPFPSPNFNCPGPKDTDHHIFHPSHTARLLIDNAVVSLKDPGVVADVSRLRSYTNLLDGYKRQRIELDNSTTRVENKLLATHSRLTHAAIRTRLIPHLSRCHPTTPPPTRVPRIFAAQGLPDVEPGEDSLACRVILGKRRRGKPCFPYCLNSVLRSSLLDCKFNWNWTGLD